MKRARVQIKKKNNSNFQPQLVKGHHFNWLLIQLSIKLGKNSLEKLQKAKVRGQVKNNFKIL